MDEAQIKELLDGQRLARFKQIDVAHIMGEEDQFTLLCGARFSAENWMVIADWDDAQCICPTCEAKHAPAAGTLKEQLLDILAKIEDTEIAWAICFVCNGTPSSDDPEGPFEHRDFCWFGNLLRFYRERIKGHEAAVMFVRIDHWPMIESAFPKFRPGMIYDPSLLFPVMSGPDRSTYLLETLKTRSLIESKHMACWKCTLCLHLPVEGAECPFIAHVSENKRDCRAFRHRSLLDTLGPGPGTEDTE